MTRWIHVSLACLAALSAAAQPFTITQAEPVIERWMYPFNADPCSRPAGSVFGTSGDESGVDTRHAQHLLGWDTSGVIPTNQGPARYLIRSCRVTLTINRGDLFVYDPTHDDYRTALPAEHPDHLADEDDGLPVELFGAGYRNGFDAASFDPCAPFGSAATGGRNAYALSWDVQGRWVDVGNNVGKTNEAFPPFEAWPFAVGRATNAAPGETLSAGSKLDFELRLEDPFVLAYLQQALDTGTLRLMVSSLHGSDGFGGAPSFPDFVTRFNAAVLNPTGLTLEGVVVSETDSDTDGLPDDWEEFYFETLDFSGLDDPDQDGLNNAGELAVGTNPDDPASTLRLSILEPESGMAIRLGWSHAANREYALEFTSDFREWTRITNFAPRFPAPGRAEWSDPAPGTGARFYRILAE